MQTIAKKTKSYKSAIDSAKGIIRYDLGNDFTGKPVSSIDATSLEMGRLKKSDSGYSLRVHSNLWYEWEAA